MSYVEFKSRFDGRWYRCRGSYVFRCDAVAAMAEKVSHNPGVEFRIA